MTADAFAQDAQRAREAGMNGHMAKPVDLGKLEKVLREWI
jgi:CheY-like chemotaxis protein